MNNDKEPVQYKAASTRWEREQAYRLLYDQYFRLGYVPGNRGGIRFNDRMAAAEAVTFIALSRDVVIATMNFFADGPQGLPMDDAFRDAIDPLRREGRKIIEIGALAHRRQDPHRGVDVFLTLARMCALYALKRGADDCVVSCVPHHAAIYAKMLHFELLTPNRSYPTLRNITALAYRMRRESMHPGEEMNRWLYNGEPIPPLPEKAPDFPAEDIEYFRSLAAPFASQGVLCL